MPEADIKAERYKFSVAFVKRVVVKPGQAERVYEFIAADDPELLVWHLSTWRSRRPNARADVPFRLPQQTLGGSLPLITRLKFHRHHHFIEDPAVLRRIPRRVNFRAAEEPGTNFTWPSGSQIDGVLIGG